MLEATIIARRTTLPPGKSPGLEARLRNVSGAPLWVVGCVGTNGYPRVEMAVKLRGPGGWTYLNLRRHGKPVELDEPALHLLKPDALFDPFGRRFMRDPVLDWKPRRAGTYEIEFRYRTASCAESHVAVEQMRRFAQLARIDLAAVPLILTVERTEPRRGASKRA